MLPEGFLLSSNSPVSDPTNPDADNVGAPLDILARLYAQTGANLVGIRYNWEECEPKPPKEGEHEYLWPSRNDDPFLKLDGMNKIVSFGDKNSWAEEIKAKDKEKYWQYFEAFVEAAAKNARERYGAQYFRVPGNEPSLKSCTPNPIYKPEYPDWHFWYMDRAIHVARAVKRANPENKVFFGQLVVGDRARIGALAQAGLKEHSQLFDVLDIHAYSRDEGVHIDMNQIIESHQVLQEIGADHIRLFLGEGWSCFPLPAELDGNLREPATYTSAHADHYRRCVFSGWYNLRTRRAGEYDPSWVMGANYFTFCDLIEGRGWAKRAVPVRNDKGEIDHYLVDGYYKGKDELGPYFRPWGLVDIQGRPKRDVHLEFPPYIPKHKIEAGFDPEPAGGEVLAGKPYRAIVTFENLESRFMQNLVFGMEGRKKSGREIQATCRGPARETRAPQGRKIERRFEVILDPKLKAKESRFFATVEFTWAGRPYRVDAWGPKVKVK